MINEQGKRLQKIKIAGVELNNFNLYDMNDKLIESEIFCF